MQSVHQISALRRQLHQWRLQDLRIGFVPTMGNLHAGHSSLIESARSRCDKVVASIFVNPLQFGLNEDFEQYPRTLEADQHELQARGADLLFAPSNAEMYPNGTPEVVIKVGEITRQLCGQFRPGHFDGVATVVNILFNLVQPDLAVFGAKDYQQLEVIRRMVADLKMPVELIAAPIVRDADGLAMSSRNQYLSVDERRQAPAIYAQLQAAAARIKGDFSATQAVCADAVKVLQKQGFEVQYFELRDASLAAPTAAGPWVLLCAAMLGRTRLIDNLAFS